MEITYGSGSDARRQSASAFLGQRLAKNQHLKRVA
jgi:hypothetical protein